MTNWIRISWAEGSAENKYTFVPPLLSHHHCLFHLTGGLSPDGLGLQGAPHAASGAGSLRHRLLSLCPSTPKEREAGCTQGERSRALQSSRSTGLRGLASVDDMKRERESDDANKNWGVGWCALTVAFSTSISRKLRSLTHSHFSEVPVIGLGFFPQDGSLLRSPFSFMFCSVKPCCDCRPAAQCGNCGLLEMHRCVCVQLNVVMQLMTLYLHLCRCWYSTLSSLSQIFSVIFSRYVAHLHTSTHKLFIKCLFTKMSGRHIADKLWIL